MTKLSKNFESGEFTCGCGCQKDKVSPILIDKLQQLRDLVGEPIIITSGYRCKAYNKHIGGAVNSPHLLGKGADIQVKGMSTITIAMIAKSIPYIRIGIYPNHIHIDIMPPAPSKYWLIKKYGQKPIYSGNETNLAKFLKNNL